MLLCCTNRAGLVAVEGPNFLLDGGLLAGRAVQNLVYSFEESVHSLVLVQVALHVRVITKLCALAFGDHQIFFLFDLGWLELFNCSEGWVETMRKAGHNQSTYSIKEEKLSSSG